MYGVTSEVTSEIARTSDPYQQGPLGKKHEVRLQSDSEASEESDGPGTTRSGQQYTLTGIEIAALSLEDSYTERSYKLEADEAQ